MINSSLYQCPTTVDVHSWQWLFFNYTRVDLKSKIVGEDKRAHTHTHPYSFSPTNALSGEKLQKGAKNLNFDIFEDPLYMESVSMPLMLKGN